MHLIKKLMYLAVALALGLWGLTGCSMGYKYDNSGLYTAGNGEVDPATVRTIDVDWLGGSVTVKPYEGDMLRFADNSAYPNEKNLLQYYLDGDELKIRFCEGYLFRLSSPEPKDLEVLVPVSAIGILQEISVDAVSAEVFISDMQLRELEIDTVSGGITVDGSAEQISIDTTSGDIALSGTFGEIETDSVSGVLTAICTECPKRFASDSTSGAFKITLPADSSFTCGYDSTSGKFVSDFDGQNTGNNMYKVGDGSNSLSFDTVSGDLHLSKK